jgi:hypothetical protein
VARRIALCRLKAESASIETTVRGTHLRGTRNAQVSCKSSKLSRAAAALRCIRSADRSDVDGSAVSRVPRRSERTRWGGWTRGQKRRGHEVTKHDDFDHVPARVAQRCSENKGMREVAAGAGCKGGCNVDITGGGLTTSEMESRWGLECLRYVSGASVRNGIRNLRFVFDVNLDLATL